MPTRHVDTLEDINWAIDDALDNPLPSPGDQKVWLQALYARRKAAAERERACSPSS